MDVSERHVGVNLNSMIVLSLILHVLALSFLMLNPPRESPRLTFGPVYTVDLVNVPVTFRESAGIGTFAGAPGSMTSPIRTPVMKKVIPQETAVSLDARKKPVAAPETMVSQAVENIRRKVESMADDSSQPVTARGSYAADTRMSVYYAVIWSRIREQWSLPAELVPHDRSMAVVGLEILRNGEVGNIVFEQSSGNKVFDESVVKAIRKASPFPPLPEWFDARVCEVGIRFYASEMK